MYGPRVCNMFSIYKSQCKNGIYHNGQQTASPETSQIIFKFAKKIKMMNLLHSFVCMFKMTIHLSHDM